MPATAQRLRAAAGDKPRIVGITYPDLLLGKWVGADADQALARLSVVAFRHLINPALVRAYTAGRGKLVDVTPRRAHTARSTSSRRRRHGAIPVPVARVCKLTYDCDVRDITPHEALQADRQMVAKTLPREPQR